MHHVTWLETSGKYWSWNLNSFQKSKVLKQQFKSKDLKYDYKNSEILHNRFCLIMPIDIEKSFKGLQIRTSPSYQVLGNTTEILGNTTEILRKYSEFDIEKSFKGLQIRTSPSFQVLGIRSSPRLSRSEKAAKSSLSTFKYYIKVMGINKVDLHCILFVNSFIVASPLGDVFCLLKNGFLSFSV